MVWRKTETGLSLKSIVETVVSRDRVNGFKEWLGGGVKWLCKDQQNGKHSIEYPG